MLHCNFVWSPNIGLIRKKKKESTMLEELREIEAKLYDVKVNNASIEDLTEAIEIVSRIKSYSRNLDFRIEDRIVEWSYKLGRLEYLKPRVNRIKESIRRGIL